MRPDSGEMVMEVSLRKDFFWGSKRRSVCTVKVIGEGLVTMLRCSRVVGTVRVALCREEGLSRERMG